MSSVLGKGSFGRGGGEGEASATVTCFDMVLDLYRWREKG